MKCKKTTYSNRKKALSAKDVWARVTKVVLAVYKCPRCRKCHAVEHKPVQFTERMKPALWEATKHKLRS